MVTECGLKPLALLPGIGLVLCPDTGPGAVGGLGPHVGLTRGEVRTEPRVPREPSADDRSLVRPVVIHNDVDVQGGRPQLPAPLPVRPARNPLGCMSRGGEELRHKSVWRTRSSTRLSPDACVGVKCARNRG